ncbi:MAG: hypothetical protein E6I26_08865 [Chloroflexi bacterium]|nr:MAG: hypothetical protein E6I26_08865 [Chloroflexota bacterium]
MPVVEVTDGVVVVLEPAPDDVVDEVDDEVVEPDVAAVDVEVVDTAAVVTGSVELPLYEMAATEPNAPTAATLATAVPIVRDRRRATARSRSAGLRRVAALVMRGGCRSNLSLS